jgi:hypothetical protein
MGLNCVGKQIGAKPNTKQITLRQTKMTIPGIEMKFLDIERSNFALSPKLEITEFLLLTRRFHYASQI